MDMSPLGDSDIEPTSLLSQDGASELDAKSDDSKQPSGDMMNQGMEMIEENPELLVGL